MKKGKSKIDNHYNWCVLGDAYFATSKKLCKELRGRYDHLSKPPRAAWGSGSLFWEMGFSDHGDHLFIYPIIFNLKHGIELYLKSFTVVANDGEFTWSHDFGSLFCAAALAVETRLGKESADEFRKLWLIIRKYYYGTYSGQIGDESRPDKKNEAERFPVEFSADHNKCKSQRDDQSTYVLPQHEFEWVNVQLIDDLIKDIDKLSKELRCYRNKCHPSEGAQV